MKFHSALCGACGGKNQGDGSTTTGRDGGGGDTHDMQQEHAKTEMFFVLWKNKQWNATDDDDDDDDADADAEEGKSHHVLICLLSIQPSSMTQVLL